MWTVSCFVNSSSRNNSVWQGLLILPESVWHMAYGTRKFNTAFTRFSSNSYPKSTQLLVFITISTRSIIIWSSHLRLGLPKGLFPVGLPVKISKALLSSSILATCPPHLNLLDLITLTLYVFFIYWGVIIWYLQTGVLCFTALNPCFSSVSFHEALLYSDQVSTSAPLVWRWNIELDVKILIPWRCWTQKTSGISKRQNYL